METRLWDNPMGILVAIRDGYAADWESLCKLCHCPVEGPYTDTIILRDNIHKLIQVGLLDGEGWEAKGKIVVTDLVEDLQIALRLSL